MYCLNSPFKTLIKCGACHVYKVHTTYVSSAVISVDFTAWNNYAFEKDTNYFFTNVEKWNLALWENHTCRVISA